jgi:hypothetical protein
VGRLHPVCSCQSWTPQLYLGHPHQGRWQVPAGACCHVMVHTLLYSSQGVIIRNQGGPVDPWVTLVWLLVGGPLRLHGGASMCSC